MKVGNQLHAPAALPPGKQPMVPILKETGWTPGKKVKVKFSLLQALEALRAVRG
jgi:hypothetical protein